MFAFQESCVTMHLAWATCNTSASGSPTTGRRTPPCTPQQRQCSWRSRNRLFRVRTGYAVETGNKVGFCPSGKRLMRTYLHNRRPNFNLKGHVWTYDMTTLYPEVSGILELGNVLVFVLLIFCPHWPMDQLNKNPKIVYLETSHQLWK